MIRRTLLPVIFLFFTFWPQVSAHGAVLEIEVFFQTLSRNEGEAKKALEQIASLWKDSYTALIVDLMTLELHKLNRRGGKGSEKTLELLLQLLTEQTRQWFGKDLARWRKWTWSLDYKPHPDLARFKGMLYAQIDPKMSSFFPDQVPSLIRLDEVEWGGVGVNGIPPLDYPESVSVSEAGYLEDSNVVFGLEINNEARAYPKRILAWHEMALDRLGGVELTLVYCTLCGTVIPYESEVGGQLVKFGTSGFLYRSNKLMFDEQSKNLWSTLEGKPVVGSLVGSGLRLRSHPLVTTTWGEWKSRHPGTTVLSRNTGHRRDYSEGAAYRDYFATDRLMFPVPKRDRRLKNKQEVLVMLLPGEKESESLPVAISTAFLEKHPVYHTRQGRRNLVVVTSPEGANRIYDAGRNRFDGRMKDFRVKDRKGHTWLVTEEALILEGGEETRLPRVSAQRAFWFGWYAQFPDTALIK